MSTLATLVVKLIGDIGGFSESMGTAETVAAKSGDNILSKLGGGLAGVAKIAAGAAVTGIGAAAAAMIGGVTAANSWAEKLDGIGDVLGTSANDSATFAVAIRGVGGDVDGLTGQFAKLANGLFDSKGELSTSGLELKKLGIAFQDSNGAMLPTTDILLNIANRLGPMQDGFAKTEAMTALFGKSGKDLSDTMSALAGTGFEKAREKAVSLGLALGEDGVNRSVAMGRAMNDLQMTLQGLAVSVGSELLPAIVPLVQQFASWAVSVMPQVRSAISSVMQGVKDLILGITTGKGPAGEFGTFVRGVFEGIVTTVGQVITWFGLNWPRIKDFVITTFGPIVAEIDRVIKWVIANWPWVEFYVGKAFADIKVWWDNVGAPAFAEVRRVFESIVKWVQENWPKVQEAFGKVVAWVQENWPKVQKAFEDVKKWIEENWPKVQQAFADAAVEIDKAYKKYIEPALNDFKKAFEKLKEFIDENAPKLENILRGLFKTIEGIVHIAMAIIKGDWDGVWDGMRETLDGISMTMSNTVSFVFNLIKRVVEETVASIKDKWEKSWEFLTGLMGRIWSSIAMAWESIKESINERVEKIKSDLKDSWNQIRNTITEKATAIWDAARNTWDTLVRDVSALPDKFLKIGRDIVYGIRDGIANAAASVFNAGSDLVQGIITVVKHDLGIRSPSKAFYDIGAYMMAGLAEGIRGASALPQNAFDGVTADMKFGDFSANGVAAASSGGSMNSRSYTLNVNNAGAPANLLGDFALLQALGG